MIARFFWFSWSPPKLDPSEQRFLAEAVRSHGAGIFVRGFLGLRSRDLPDGRFHSARFLETHTPGLIYLALIICGFLFAGKGMPAPSKDSAASVLVFFVAVGWLGAILFYSSLLIATGRYAAWLSAVARRYSPEPEPFHVQPDPPASAVTEPHAQQEDSVIDAHISRVVECSGCGQKLRVPASVGRLNIRCPKCRLEWETDT